MQPGGIQIIWYLQNNAVQISPDHGNQNEMHMGNKSEACLEHITSRKLSCLRYLQVTAFPRRQAFVPTARLTIQ